MGSLICKKKAPEEQLSFDNPLYGDRTYLYDPTIDECLYDDELGAMSLSSFELISDGD